MMTIMLGLRFARGVRELWWDGGVFLGGGLDVDMVRVDQVGCLTAGGFC